MGRGQSLPHNSYIIMAPHLHEDHKRELEKIGFQIKGAPINQTAPSPPIVTPADAEIRDRPPEPRYFTPRHQFFCSRLSPVWAVREPPLHILGFGVMKIGHNHAEKIIPKLLRLFPENSKWRIPEKLHTATPKNIGCPTLTLRS